MRTETLVEYQPKPRVPLSADERDGLRRVALSVAVTPSIGAEGCYDLTPGSWVGAINLGTLAIEIKPKIPTDRVLFLLSYALDPKRWKETPFDYGEERSLVEAIVPGFAFQVRCAFSRGLLHGYRREDDALPTVRGRIRFDDQIRDRFGLFPPVEVSYDNHTEDIEENRIIKAAIGRIGRLRLRSSSSARTLRAFDSVLQAVCSVHYDQRSLPRTTYTRLNEHYRPAVELAKLILRSSSFELRHGEVHAAAFLVDMNDVFENFVYVAVREALCLSERAFPQGGRGRRLFLDGAAKIELRPDLSWWDGERCTFIGDVKYKQAEAAGGPNADVYQLLAYTIATDLPGGLLVYGALRGEMVAHRIVNVGKDLAVAAIDLRGTPEEMLGQAKTITSQISRLRELARGDSLAVMA